jgi:type IV secretory pathway TrbD component
MQRSSFGPHREETSWAATQTPRLQPRIVRVGRPANDNFRRPGGARTWMLIAGLAGAALALVAANWRFF